MGDFVYDYVYTHQQLTVEDYSSSVYDSIVNENINTEDSLTRSKTKINEHYSTPVDNCHSAQFNVNENYSTTTYDSLVESSYPKQFIVNTKNFSPQDLQLFVDSLEIITRLKKVKHEKRLRLKQNSHDDETFNNTCLDSNRNLNFSSDYNYYGSFYSVQRQSGTSTVVAYNEDSKDSGLFLDNTFCPELLYENLKTKRSILKSFKSILTSLIRRKKQYAKYKTSGKDILSSATIHEQLEEEASCKCIEEFIKNHDKKKCHNVKSNSKSMYAEEKNIDKKPCIALHCKGVNK